jgi:hypothetical protein
MHDARKVGHGWTFPQGSWRGAWSSDVHIVLALRKTWSGVDQDCRVETEGNFMSGVQNGLAVRQFPWKRKAEESSIEKHADRYTVTPNNMQ